VLDELEKESGELQKGIVGTSANGHQLTAGRFLKQIELARGIL